MICDINLFLTNNDKNKICCKLKNEFLLQICCKSATEQICCKSMTRTNLLQIKNRTNLFDLLDQEKKCLSFLIYCKSASDQQQIDQRIKTKSILDLHDQESLLSILDLLQKAMTDQEHDDFFLFGQISNRSVLLLIWNDIF
ncbi:hypothetical protein Scep_013436 [Stephania cephalantha]|uniref:Uncharacterized protein n=1 Tax=Stephania cephalantha TaxID=152367 RepID=A0AAP0JIT8_9MAGN